MTVAASPTPSERASAALAELRRASAGLDPRAALALRAEISSIGEALIGQALDAALAGNGHNSAGSQDLTVEEAEKYLHRSTSWLHHNWRRLRLGFLDGGRLRFRRADLDRYLSTCRRRAR